MYHENCIFCKIVNKEIPCYKFYEDSNFIGFLSIAPHNKGHSLVVPKDHYRWVWDHPNIGAYFEVVQEVVQAQKKAFNTDLIVGMQVGEEVPHAHVSLIPRFENDNHGGSINTAIKHSFSAEEMTAIAKMIEENMDGSARNKE